MEKLVPVGRIIRPHGIKGEIKLNPYFEPLEQYEDFETLYIKPGQGRETEYHVEAVRYQKRFVILKLIGCDNINDVQKMSGQEVLTSSTKLPPLPEDEFYWHDLEGLAVYDESGKYLGRVKEIFPTGSNDVIVIGDGREELLLPAIKEVVRELDLKSMKMTVRPQEWLE